MRRSRRRCARRSRHHHHSGRPDHRRGLPAPALPCFSAQIEQQLHNRGPVECCRDCRWFIRQTGCRTRGRGARPVANRCCFAARQSVRDSGSAVTKPTGVQFGLGAGQRHQPTPFSQAGVATFFQARSLWGSRWKGLEPRCPSVRANLASPSSDSVLRSSPKAPTERLVGPLEPAHHHQQRRLARPDGRKRTVSPCLRPSRQLIPCRMSPLPALPFSFQDAS